MPTSCLRIIPLAKISAFEAATNQGGDSNGLDVSVSVYTAADAPTRPETHRLASSVPNAAQLSFLQGLGTTGQGYVDMAAHDANLSDCIVKLWTVPGANPQSGILSTEGLTLNPN